MGQKKGTTGEWLAYIRNNLMRQIENQINAMPAGFNKDRFVLNCITVCQDMLNDPKKKDSLLKVDAATIPVCFMKGAFLGLDFFNGECYAIPYGNTMNFQTDYKGEIKLVKRYAKNRIKDVFAKNVREGDYFEESVIGGIQSITFKPIPFNDAPIIGTFAVVLYEDGQMIYDTMSKKEIENIRSSFSKAQNSTAWRNTPGEMYKKTVIRRITKLVDCNFDTIEQMRAYEDGSDVDFNKGIHSHEEPAALPENEKPVDVFETVARAKKKEPVVVKTVEAEVQEPENEYAVFDQRYNPDDFIDIPDNADEETPFM